jgi:hypothetical protein
LTFRIILKTIQKHFSSGQQLIGDHVTKLSLLRQLFTSHSTAQTVGSPDDTSVHDVNMFYHVLVQIEGEQKNT